MGCPPDAGRCSHAGAPRRETLTLQGQMALDECGDGSNHNTSGRIAKGRRIAADDDDARPDPARKFLVPGSGATGSEAWSHIQKRLVLVQNTGVVINLLTEQSL